MARPTNPAPHPKAFVAVIVGLAEPLSMADDRMLAANRTPPREEAQRNHPGSMLSFASGSAIKRITAGVRAAAGSLCQDCSGDRPSPSWCIHCRTKKENCFRRVSGRPPYGLADPAPVLSPSQVRTFFDCQARCTDSSSPMNTSDGCS